jgi:thiol-disulfide isomerase/thioredoxin
MTNEMTTSQLEQKLREGSFSVILFYADGCHHCQQVKPVIEEVKKQLVNSTFYSIDISSENNHMELYNKYAKLEQEKEYKEADGQTLVRLLYNEDGTPRMVKGVSIPDILMFSSKEVDEEDNENGFIGKVSGNLPDKITGVLQQYYSMYTDKPMYIDKPKYNVLGNGLKSLTRIAKNKVTGVDDKVPVDVSESRLGKCYGCPHLNKVLKNCGICKCIVAEKVKYKEEFCPDGRWSAYQG